MKDSRQIAFDILLRMHRDESFSNIILDNQLKKETLNQRDVSFVTALVYGVLERKISLDFQLQERLRQKLNKLKPEVYITLQLGAYQLLYMDKVPSSAAVNESVKLVQKNKSAFASGLVNAVLRRIEREGALPVIKESNVEIYSIEYSFPQELVSLWINAYGEDNAKAIMANALQVPPTYLRVNTLKTTPNNLIAQLKREKVTANICEDIENCLVVSSVSGLEQLPSFQQGLFHVQDLASQFCVKALNAKEGANVYDMCSAPGGKSFTIAQYMKNKGKLYAFDIHEHRLDLIRKGAERLGITNMAIKKNDASVLNEALNQKKADFILCDVPCSGFGTVRRKPEIKYKTLSSIQDLPKLQYQILKASAAYLEIGGRLIYSTCTLNPKENEEVYLHFLKENPKYKPVSLGLDESGDTYRTFFPHVHQTDGFFIAALTRTD